MCSIEVRCGQNISEPIFSKITQLYRPFESPVPFLDVRETGILSRFIITHYYSARIQKVPTSQLLEEILAIAMRYKNLLKNIM